jgi:predicted RNase H-like nuclease
MSWVAGADGFKSRWCVILWHLDTGELRCRIASFSELLELPERPLAVGVDIPIGLPEVTPPGGRTCEKEARRVLGRKASCVFSAVGRSALKGSSRAEADRLSREAGGIGIGAQAWGLSAKLQEADEAMTPERQKIIYEVHPEVSFWALNEGVPMTGGKKTAQGAKERIEALVRGGFPREFVRLSPADLKVGRDDFLDACAAAWTARRVATGRAGRFPAMVEHDARGLDMAIWF